MMLTPVDHCGETTSFLGSSGRVVPIVKPSTVDSYVFPVVLT